MSQAQPKTARAMIEIVRAGVLASVQDLGRTGYRRFGVCTSGALDPLSLYVGNRLVGNRSDAAGVEFTLGNATLRFLADGLLQQHGDRLSLTPRGILYSNEVFQEFLES